MPLRRSALSVCPCGGAWGTLLRLEIRHSWAPVKPPRGQTLRSPRPHVTSVSRNPVRVETALTKLTDHLGNYM